jgi:uncharacterized repeat protein (TIGR03803 family)
MTTFNSHVAAREIIARHGKQYPLTIAALFLITMCAILPAQAQNFSVLYSFTGAPDGSEPSGVLIQDAAGNFYGTTYSGGAYNWGTVYKLDSQNNETILYSFKGKRGGLQPNGIVEDAAGNFYGTTALGGDSGYGTIFKLAPNGKLAILHSFSGSPNDGRFPEAAPILDAAGNLYGTTTDGGSGNCYEGCGTVWELDSAGTYSVLHNFAGYPTDGQSPNTPLVEDAQGNLYGTTFIGGNSTCTNYNTSGCGTVFRINATGTETILHSFLGAPKDGDEPAGGLFRDEKGNLFGTTETGGKFYAGNVFRLNTAGKMTTLYSFDGNNSGAEYPYSGVVRDAEGNFYGTTQDGGEAGCAGSGCGTIFELTKSRVGSVLFAFPSEAQDGGTPITGPIFGSSGNLYGVVPFGGVGYGVVYEITP